MLWVDWFWFFGGYGWELGFFVEYGAGAGFGRDRVQRFFGWCGVIRDLADSLIDAAIEADTAGVLHGDVEGSQDQRGAFDVERVADQAVDDFHERGLDGVFVFDDGDGMQAREGRSAHAAMSLLVEVAELFSAKCGASATDSGDFDMSAGFVCWHGRYPVQNILVVTPENLGSIGVREILDYLIYVNSC